MPQVLIGFINHGRSRKLGLDRQISRRSSRHRDRRAQLLKCPLLDLTYALGADPEVTADVVEGPGPASEPVMVGEDPPLALVELLGELAHLLDLHLLEDPSVV